MLGWPPLGRVCLSGSLVAARVRGLCTVQVTKSGAVALAEILPIVAHTVEDSGSWIYSESGAALRLGYRDADSPQELRLLLACVPARTTNSLLLLTQPLEVRPDDTGSPSRRVELEANAAVVVKG